LNQEGTPEAWGRTRYADRALLSHFREASASLTEAQGVSAGDNFPASAIINIRSLAQPDLLIEIQSVAVIG
jgi:enamine deaminase RidA (YjgF/YER057c/UK114 family)